MKNRRAFYCLIVDDEPDLRELVGELVESIYGATVKYAASGFEAIELLKTEVFDCVISDYRMPNGTGGDIFAFVSQNCPSLDFVLCCSDLPGDLPEFKSASFAGHAPKPFFQKELQVILDQITLRPRLASPGSPKAGGYYAKFSVKLLRRLERFPCDLWVKLGEDKFLKFFNENDPIQEADHQRLSAKGFESLYLGSNDVSRFFDSLIEQAGRPNAHPEKSVQSEVALIAEIQDVVNDIASQYGFTPEVERLVNRSVSMTLKLIKESKGLSEILAHIRPGNPSYVSFHSFSVAAVACELAARMNWASEQTLIKLTLAALLHDVTLRDGNLARVQSEAGLLSSVMLFSELQHKAWLSHTVDAAAILGRFSELPADVQTIVLQHHEMPDGSGHPGGLTHDQITPLAAIFIVAHDIVTYVHNTGLSFNPGVYVNEQGPKFSAGKFKKILRAILQPFGQAA